MSRLSIRVRIHPWRSSIVAMQETAAAARDATAIGGRPADPELEPALRALAEGGQGVPEGFELAEQELIEAAEHGDSAVDPLADGFTVEAVPQPAVGQ